LWSGREAPGYDEFSDRDRLTQQCNEDDHSDRNLLELHDIPSQKYRGMITGGAIVTITDV